MPSIHFDALLCMACMPTMPCAPPHALHALYTLTTLWLRSMLAPCRACSASCRG